jgi:endonuclease/exonuclease/phosphatase family metal-dependent hydrolase
VSILSKLPEVMTRQLIRLAAHLPAFLLPGETRVPGHPSAIRVMTYNVHGCVGTDDHLSVERIASVIARHGADVAALQEVDVGKSRSGFVDQAGRVGELAGMHVAFGAASRSGSERYGNAVLSRWPLRVVRRAALPARTPRAERRSALRVAIDHPYGELQLVNTHLSVDRDERLLQARMLAEDWASEQESGPFILCGDFNARPGSPPHLLLSGALRDARQGRAPAPRRATWPAPMPVFRLDHVFVGQRIHVDGVEVPFNRLTRVASDHLPVIATVRMY